MLETIQRLILDFQEHLPETVIPRLLTLQSVPGKATVCIGVRRSGKTTLMYQQIEKLIEEGAPRENIVHLNFFDDRLHGLRHDGLGQIPDAYYTLFPGKKDSEKVYFFFDEIQMVERWEAFVDRLMRTENCEVYLTGSSAKMLSKEIGSQMRGRALAWELFPFSFREFLRWKGIEVALPLSTKQQHLVKHAFEEYWEMGGFPEVLSAEREVRVRIHQDYYQAILYRDLIDRHDISHPRALYDVSHRLIENAGSLYTINALHGYLKSLGHGGHKSIVSDYLEWFEDAFFLFTVTLFDASAARRNVNPKKIYCIDHAFVRSIAPGIRVNSGHLLENVVFIALRTTSEKIHYYRTRSGREVDFVLPEMEGEPLLVQVCESLDDATTRQRELSALDEAMAEMKIDRAVIVTRHLRATESVKHGTVEVVPIWHFLLGGVSRQYT